MGGGAGQQSGDSKSSPEIFSDEPEVPPEPREASLRDTEISAQEAQQSTSRPPRRTRESLDAESQEHVESPGAGIIAPATSTGAIGAATTSSGRDTLDPLDETLTTSPSATVEQDSPAMLAEPIDPGGGAPTAPAVRPVTSEPIEPTSSLEHVVESVKDALRGGKVALTPGQQGRDVEHPAGPGEEERSSDG